MVLLAFIVACVCPVFLAIVGALVLEAVEKDLRDTHARHRDEDKNDMENKLWALRIQLNETREKVGLPPIKTQRPLPDDEGVGWSGAEQQEFIRSVVEGRS